MENPVDNAAPAESAPTEPQSGGTLLGQVQTQQPAQPADQAPATSWQDTVPEKFKSNGEVNFEALTKSYLHLEQRLGSGDAPPASPDKYEMKLPEGLQAEQFEGVRKSAHELGLSQKQLDGVMAQYFETIPQFIEQVSPNPAKAEAALREVWQDSKEFNTNMGLANRAFKAYAGNDISIDDIGNNPAAIKLLAKIGATLGEDNPVNSAAILTGEKVTELMSSEAYSNPRHPQHKNVHAQVRAHYENQTRMKG